MIAERNEEDESLNIYIHNAESSTTKRNHMKLREKTIRYHFIPIYDKNIKMNLFSDI